MSDDLAQLFLVGPVGPMLLFLVLTPTLIGISEWRDRRRDRVRKPRIASTRGRSAIGRQT